MHHMDPKYNDTRHYICLKKKLYRIKQAAHNWFRHLRDGLFKRGFWQSQVDCCLFLRHDRIILVYVDGCLLFAPRVSTIDIVIKNLSTEYMLQDKGDVSAYLGVQVVKDKATKTITLTQPGLIARVIKDVGFNPCSKGKDTPADTIQYADADGPPRRDTWNYRSVLGKLNYIANNTRPDISMVVLKPSANLILDMYVDSDFTWYVA
jgi:hypothetical protein